MSKRLVQLNNSEVLAGVCPGPLSNVDNKQLS